MSKREPKHRGPSKPIPPPSAQPRWVARRTVSQPGFWEWQSLRPILLRATAHVSVVLLVIVVIALSSVKLPQRTLENPLSRENPLPTQSPLPTPLPIEPINHQDWPLTSALLVRRAQPYTIIPERPRKSVITYTVQSGDTVFGIARAFDLNAHTIYWANSDTLRDNPHMLWPNMVLNILPVNGIYHTVEAGETVPSISKDYGVDSEILFNEWNDLEEEQPLQEGSHLVIPGGTRDFLVWQLPQYSDLQGAAAAGAGVCALPSIGLRGVGWLVWPTDSRRISGWVFHDIRNPPHAGLDIGLYTGDPIYAADNGVVAYAGWNDWGYGYLIVLDHGNGFHTYYGHLSAIWVTCGQSVYQGAAIGAGGSTGRSSGPHLHFEVRYEGVPQDPAYYLP